MDIRSLMTANPACCSQDTSLQEVARMMKDNDCGEIPVVDDAGKPLGVITDRDIAVRAVARGEAATASVADYMTAPVATISQQDSVADCCQLMERNKIRRIVVVDEGGSVAGIVSQADIARAGTDAKTAEVVKQVSEPGA